MSIWRRLRGVVGTAMTWAAGWGLVGGALNILATAVGWNGFLTSELWIEALVHASMGFIGGTAFSSGLVLSERHGALARLSPLRAAGWGVLAGLVGPIAIFLLGTDASILELLTTWYFFAGTGVFGAASGAGMAAIARQGEVEELQAADTERLGSGSIQPV